MGKKRAGRAGVLRDCRFDLEDEVQGPAKGFSSEGDGLADGGWTFWLNTFWLDIAPLEIAFPLYEVPPDHLNRGRDDGGGTNVQTHSVCLLSNSGSRPGIIPKTTEQSSTGCYGSARLVFPGGTIRRPAQPSGAAAQPVK